MRLTVCAFAICCAPFARGTAQQGQTFTRAQAVAAAMAHGPRLAVAGADTTLAAAQMITAHALPNPALSATYSKSTPNYHVTAEMPLDFIGLRGAKIRSADAAQTAARFRFAFSRASIALDADTTYTRALAGHAHVELSRRNALAADSVRLIAVARRDVGDASELDVQLATVTAGQAANVAATDSVSFAAALLDLQAVLGMPTDVITIALADTLAAPPTSVALPAVDATLPVASANASVQSTMFGVQLQHRSVFLLPSVVFGFETGDPTGSEPGILPTFGIALPLPLFNRNRGPIAEAEAQHQRAIAELALARIDVQNEITHAGRALVAARARLDRDRLLVTSANRVADMSLAAYREGAAPLTSVLEAQRSAREILGQYIDDIAAASNAASILRVLTLTPSSVSLP